MVTKLSRHQDWMGLSYALANADRLRFIVYPKYEHHNSPGYAVGYPAEEPLGPDEHTTPFPGGQATVLRDILT